MATHLLASLASEARVPGPNDGVSRDECVASFDTPESEGGIFVSLNSFLGFNRKFVDVYHRNTGHRLFLNIQTFKTEIPKESENDGEPPMKKPTILGIGVEGGFDVNKPKYEYLHINTLVVLPGFDEYPLPDAELPAQITASIEGILNAESTLVKDTVNSWTEQRLPSAFAASLVQQDNGVKIPPSGWKCSLCDITDNLWLNLSDGTILCGRSNFDGTGGNGHALQYYKTTGFPVVVKLGTITPEGADVFSYAEDEMVTDPNLADHLSHFGINMQSMTKTAASMAELQVELNMNLNRFEWNRLQEEGKELVPLYGPGFTGLINLGNTCYMNSVLQSLFCLPEVRAQYTASYQQYSAAIPANINTLDYQMSRLAYGLLSGDYSHPEPEAIKGISPRTFKSLVGRGHPEFSTNKQQDALEYFQYLLTQLDRQRNVPSPSSLFNFKLEHRRECGTSHQVTYGSTSECNLLLPVPASLASNTAEVAAYEQRVKDAEEAAKVTGAKVEPESPVLPIITLQQCFDARFGDSVVDNWLSPVTNTRTNLISRDRFETFPKYLVLGLAKFYLGQDWTPKKKAVKVIPTDEIDLSALRGTGVQQGEVAMTNSATTAAAPVAPVINEAFVAELIGMGFAPNGCRRAVMNNPTSLEAATEWVFAHMSDPDFDAPIPAPVATSGGSAAPVVEPSEENIIMIESMGFPRAHAVKALKATDNNVERAADWIFSRIGQLDDDVAPESAPVPAPGAGAGDAAALAYSGRYRLKGFISHMGSSTMCGHYVCHLRMDDGRWVLFNDEKVLASDQPPSDLAYIYIYEAI